MYIEFVQKVLKVKQFATFAFQISAVLVVGRASTQIQRAVGATIGVTGELPLTICVQQL